MAYQFSFNSFTFLYDLTAITTAPNSFFINNKFSLDELIARIKHNTLADVEQYLKQHENELQANKDILNTMYGSESEFYPMDYACYYNPKVIPILVKWGANLNSVKSREQTFLMRAISANNEEAALELLKAGADVHIAAGTKKLTALHFAFQYCPNLIGPLRDLGAEVKADFVDSNGKTLLMLAIKAKDIDFAHKILPQANLTLTDDEGRTVLFYAAEYCPTLIPWILEKITAADSKRIQELKQNAEIDLNQDHKAGNELAASNAMVDPKRAMLALRDKEYGQAGLPVLNRILRHPNVSVASLAAVVELLEAGADVNDDAGIGLTPLRLALHHPNALDLIPILVAYGADLTKKYPMLGQDRAKTIFELVDEFVPDEKNRGKVLQLLTALQVLQECINNLPRLQHLANVIALDFRRKHPEAGLLFDKERDKLKERCRNHVLDAWRTLLVTVREEQQERMRAEKKEKIDEASISAQKPLFKEAVLRLQELKGLELTNNETENLIVNMFINLLMNTFLRPRQIELVFQKIVSGSVGLVKDSKNMGDPSVLPGPIKLLTVKYLIGEFVGLGFSTSKLQFTQEAVHTTNKELLIEHSRWLREILPKNDSSPYKLLDSPIFWLENLYFSNNPPPVKPDASKSLQTTAKLVAQPSLRVQSSMVRGATVARSLGFSPAGNAHLNNNASNAAGNGSAQFNNNASNTPGNAASPSNTPGIAASRSNNASNTVGNAAALSSKKRTKIRRAREDN